MEKAEPQQRFLQQKIRKLEEKTISFIDIQYSKT